ncbi:hypothetical protein [Deinococcus marmoris]|uniref:Uncharacterized protein n=1 Tax=Deinococcus marmoris TaxID=249408 RepID=A0A1U7NTU0_9DEIO|nr:hypothetical protein [Deinococcus marmoris]OLV16330.1 hypothetical protein BOO71_0012121 [Deinococcus marmoris]
MNMNATTKQKSAGTLRTRLNGLKHGVSARFLTENEQEAYQEHLAQLQADLQPVGYLEGKLVEGIAYTLWRREKLYHWQEVTTQSQARQALEAAAYPDSAEIMMTELLMAQGQAALSLPAALLRLAAAAEDAGLFKPAPAGVADHLDTLRGAAEHLHCLTPPADKTAANLRGARADLVRWLDRVDGLLAEQQAVKSIPNEHTLGLVMRYEGSLDRALMRNLAQLRALQAQQLGKKIADMDEEEDDHEPA